jgi:hypothetical protein
VAVVALALLLSSGCTSWKSRAALFIWQSRLADAVVDTLVYWPVRVERTKGSTPAHLARLRTQANQPRLPYRPDLRLEWW